MTFVNMEKIKLEYSVSSDMKIMFHPLAIE